MKIFGWLFLTLLLGGCANSTAVNAVRILNRDAENAGSPFRWKSDSIQGQTIMQLVMIDLPSGPTKTEPALRAKIMAQINLREAEKDRPPAQVADVKLMPDGREVWVLRSIKYGVAYVVTFGRNSAGQYGFSLEGPVAFQREGDLPRDLELVRARHLGSMRG